MEFLSTLMAVFKFWDQVTWLVKTLQGTPAEHQDAIMKDMKAQAETYAKTGRPVWD